eukprot:m.307790 g.307790  ORF g.307790 m.307790 type:complete len:417 (+) comp27394_c0_seq1:80-1330(+)
MATMEKSSWVEVQSDTFVKWVNSELRQVKGFEGRVEDLAKDFQSGVILIELITKVVGKQFGMKVIRQPKFKMHEMENLNCAFKYLSENEVKLVNIGPEDVYDGRLKLILGLLWTLISNFSIVHRLRGDPENKMGAKQLLLQWVNSKVSPTFVQNFKSDWRDGKVLARLTNVLGREIYVRSVAGHDAPGVRAEADMVPQALIDSGDTDALVSATIVTAEKRLCVTQLLDAATIQSDACDDHSMMTYISLFCDACMPEAPALDSAKPEESALDAAPEDLTTTLKDVDTNTSPATAAPVSDSTPPLQRAADWRAYSGIDLGGRCRIRVYYSTTTHSVLVRKNTECLQTLFEALKVHQREDFEPWIPLDMDMDREFRNKIFDKAGTRESPMVFVDDEYIGNYADVTELNSTGDLQRILNY